MLAGILALSPNCHQNSAVAIGTRAVVHSARLKEDQTIFVALPQGYRPSGRQVYPVLYVLDGETNFINAAVASRVLKEDDSIPPMIVVGVTSAHRYDDLTTPVSGGFVPAAFIKHPGGSERFESYLTDELEPFVRRNFRAAPMSVIEGHSLGGLLAMDLFLRDRQKYFAYILLEPSVFWNDGLESDGVSKALTTETDNPRVFLGRQRLPKEVWFPQNARLVEAIAAARNSKRAAFYAEFDATHSEVAFPGTFFGLRMLFNDYRMEARADLTLDDAIGYYRRLSHVYGYDVPVPSDLLSLLLDNAQHRRDAREVSSIQEMQASLYSGASYGQCAGS